MKNLLFLTLFICLNSCTSHKENKIDDVIKVSLRQVGHQLLLSNNDSTSIVKPVISIDKNKYELSFKEQLRIQPDSLVRLIKTSFEKSELSNFYLVEVLNCNDRVVAYSYEMKENLEKGIIPCRGRALEKDCYLITIRFTNTSEVKDESLLFKYIIISVLFFIIGFILYYKKIKNKNLEPVDEPIEIDENFSSLGIYKFYPDENKLIKEASEIKLYKKECELLAIFINQPNKIIKREELTKRVWEDHGVVVGRSLDTYISKLRNKLKDDKTIKITNVHGVGYKLEV